MKITIHKGMITIDDDSFAYGSIEKMYQYGKMGIGLQVDEGLMLIQDDIAYQCNKISEAIYKLQELLKPCS